MKEMEIVAFKHNGKMHRCWYNTFLVEDNKDYAVVGSNHSFVIEADGRKWHAIEPAISIFFKDKWFNIVAMMKNTGINYYVNIASPSIVENCIIKYIDYDLDFKVDDNYEIKTLDVFEYKKHRMILNYSDELDEVINYNFDKVKKMIEHKEFPFNHECIEEFYIRYLKSRENEANDV